MTPARHGISRASLAELARGDGVRALHELIAAQRSKRLLLLRGIAEAATAVDHPQAELTRAGYAELARVQRAAPAACEPVICYPAVGVWVARTARLLRAGHGTRAEPGWLAAIAVASAAAARVPSTLLVPADQVNRVTLPRLGVARLNTTRRPAAGPHVFPGRPIEMRVSGDAVRLRGPGGIVALPADPWTDAPGWRGLRRLHSAADGLRLEVLFDDLSPTRFPDTQRTGRLPEPAMRAWRRRVADGWRLLTEQHRTVAAEAAAVLRVLTPLRAPPGTATSASARAAFGCVALSVPADARSLAATFAHEIQHIKLGAVQDLFELTDDTREPPRYVPWRTDPRPCSAALQGAYAHLGVAAFWELRRHRERDPDVALRAHAEFARWAQAAARVAHELYAGRGLTPIGRLFVTELLTTLDELRRAPVPPSAAAAAREAAAAHRARHAGAPDA